MGLLFSFDSDLVIACVLGGHSRHIRTQYTRKDHCIQRLMTGLRLSCRDGSCNTALCNLWDRIGSSVTVPGGGTRAAPQCVQLQRRRSWCRRCAAIMFMRSGHGL